MNTKTQSIIWWVILAVIIIRFATFISSNKNYFTRTFDPQFFSDLYSKSQYVLGPASIGGIGDDGLYAFAGYYYLFQGGDVTNVNFEHPPLGKYLIGISIFLFKNENIINIIYFLLILFITYKISGLVWKDPLLSIIAVAIISFDPLINDHVLRSLLDLPFTIFFLSGIYFSAKGFKNIKDIYIASVFWSAAFVAKFFPFLFVIYLIIIFFTFIWNKKLIRHVFLSSLLVPITYVIFHFSFFVYHRSFVEFLRHKKWMLNWWTGSPRIFGNLVRNIFTGTYLDSSLRFIEKNEFWNLSIPFITIFSIFNFGVWVNGKKNKALVFIYSITLAFLIYNAFISSGVMKYIMPVYPLMVILAIYNLSCIIRLCRTQITLKSRKKL